MAFRQPLDIINRALVHLGAERVRTLTDHNVGAVEANAAYDDLRAAELRRNLWTFATRRVVLRAVDTSTVLWTPAAYATGTTYGHGAVVSYNGDWWESQVSANTGNTPAPGAYWQHYYGADSATTYNGTTSYVSGELVVGSDNAIYRSLITGNAVDPVAVGTGWLALGGTTTALSVLYPIGAGPAADSATRNIFRLPRGYLRRAPTDPHAGYHPYLGGPANYGGEDWTFEGGYIVTGSTGPIMLRYVADATDVTLMDPMYCEGLAARIAEEIGPRVLTADPASDREARIAGARAHYKLKMSEARLVNGIEAGPTEAWEDDFITVRY